MKITRKKLQNIIKEEVRKVINEQGMFGSDTSMADALDQSFQTPARPADDGIHNQVMRRGYGVVGSVQSRRGPKDYGRYTSNNGVIGIIQPGKNRGHQYFPRYRGSGNLGEILELVRSMGYREEGMPLKNASEETLYRLASHV